MPFLGRGDLEVYGDRRRRETMIDYHILPEQRLIVICNWGRNTVEDVLRFSQNLRADPDFSQEFDTIVDTTQLERPYTSDEMFKLAEPRIDTSMPVGKVAVIASADITFGMSRMHEIIAETKSNHVINVFRDTDSALKWIDRQGLDVETLFKKIKKVNPVGPMGRMSP